MDKRKNIVDPFIEIADQDVDYGGQFYLWDWAHDLRAYRDTWHEPEQKPHEERNFIFSMFDSSGELSGWLGDKIQAMETHQNWAQTIPLHLRKIVGELSQHDKRFPQLMILRLMKHHPDFCAWIEQLVAHKQSAYLKAIFTYTDFVKLPLVVQEALLLNLPNQVRHHYLARLTELPVQKSHLNYIYKLAVLNQIWDVRTLQSFLIRLYDETSKQTKMMFSQMDVINLNTFKVLEEWPEWLYIPQLWQSVAYLKIEDVREVLPPLILDADTSKQKGICKAFKDVNDLRSLEHELYKLSQRYAVEKEFPEPPLPSNEKLIAIISGEKLKQEGKDLEHCVASYANAVLRGEKYYYHWVGDEVIPMPLTVELSPFKKSSQWEITQALGFKNKSINKDQQFYLKQQFSDLNPPWGYLILKTSISDFSLKRNEQVDQELEVWGALNFKYVMNEYGFIDEFNLFTLQGSPLGHVGGFGLRELEEVIAYGGYFKIRLNYVNGNYATVNIYLAPTCSS